MAELPDAKIFVSIGGSPIWERWHKDGQSGGLSQRNLPMLEQVTAALSEALEQAQFEAHSITVNE